MDRRIGAQFYTLREHIQNIEDFDTTCKKVSEIGFKTVQISGTTLEAKPMREILDKYNLQAVTSHRSFDDFKKNLDAIIEYNKILGIDLCGIGSMPFEYTKSNDSLSQFIKEANTMCEILEKENMYFGYHNHAFEFALIDGKLIFDRLVKETNPKIFNFIADTYWLQIGGKNPCDVIKSLGKRAMAIHFKDSGIDANNWTSPCMREVGKGNLNWDAIIEACDEAGSRWALIEQDTNWVDNDPFKALKTSYDYLTQKGFN